MLTFWFILVIRVFKVGRRAGGERKKEKEEGRQEEEVEHKILL